MTRATRSVVLSLVLVLVLGGFAAGETLEEIIRALEEKSQSLKDMSCDIKMNVDIMKQKMSAEGSMKMLLPDKFAMDLRMKMPEMKMDMTMKMVSDGEVMYQDIEADGRRMVNKVDVKAAGINMSAGNMPGMGGPGMGMTPSAAESLKELQKLMDVEQKADAVLDDGQAAWVIEGKFKPEAYRMMTERGGVQGLDAFKSQMAGVRLYIGKQDKFMNRMEFLTSDGKTGGSMEFIDLKINVGLTAADFTYAPPEGVTVNDMTEMMRAFQPGAGTPGVTMETTAPAPGTPPSSVLKVGVSAPAFTVTTVTGGKLDLSTLRGRPVVVFFWATWHKGSVGLLGEMDAIAKLHKPRGLEVVALSLDEPTALDDVRKALAEKGVTCLTAIGNDAIFDAYWISEIPSYVLMDAEGKVLSSEAKPKDLAQLTKTLDDLLKKAEAKVVKK